MLTLAPLADDPAARTAACLPYAALAAEVADGTARSTPVASGARGPVLFKSCGWAGRDLAAARLAASGSMNQANP